MTYGKEVPAKVRTGEISLPHQQNPQQRGNDAHDHRPAAAANKVANDAHGSPRARGRKVAEAASVGAADASCSSGIALAPADSLGARRV